MMTTYLKVTVSIPRLKGSICVGKWTNLSLITIETVHLKNHLTKVHSVKAWHEEILSLTEEMQNKCIKKSFDAYETRREAWWKVQETMRWAAHGNEEKSQLTNGVDWLDEWNELRGWRRCWTRISNKDLNEWICLKVHPKAQFNQAQAAHRKPRTTPRPKAKVCNDVITKPNQSAVTRHTHTEKNL